jgi:hypothetical protein
MVSAVLSRVMPVTHLVVRDANRRWRTARRIRRAVLLFALLGMTTGAGLVTAGVALAAGGSQPGNLILRPASGATTLRPTWSTTDGCPAGYHGSAQLSEFNTNGTLASRISPTVAKVTRPFSGTLDGDIGALLRRTDIKKGGTIQFAVGCYSLKSGKGKVEYVQSTFVTLSSAGTSYTTSSSLGSQTAGTVPITVTVPGSSPGPTASATSSPGPTSSGPPSGGAQTGAGGASLPGGGNDLLIALGATLLAGSAAAAGLAVRRARALPGKHHG